MNHLALTLLLLLLCTCRGQPATDNLRHDNERALREWRRNELIIMRSLEGSSGPDELLDAAVFFEKLTGISVHGNTTTFGLMPDERTKKDLEKLQQWYKKNEHRIFWDETSSSVKLKTH